MSNPIADVEEAGCLLIVGSNTAEAHPIIANRIRKAVRERGTKVIVIDPRHIEFSDLADIWVRPHSGTDIPLLNGIAKVILEEDLWDHEFIAQRTENFAAWRDAVESFSVEEAAAISGVSVEDIRTIARLYAQPHNGVSSIIYCLGITEHICGTDNVIACANLALLTGNMGKVGGGVNPLRGQNNVQGSCDQGCLPNYLPGYQKVSDDAARAKFSQAWERPIPAENGLTIREMFEAALVGDIKTMLIVGANLALTESDANHVRRALAALDLLVVSDIFMSDIAEMAHVVLPDASFVEKDGTFTNTERRVQRVRQASPPVGNSRPSWQVVAEIAKRVAQRLDLPSGQFEYTGPEAILAEMAGLSPVYGGISFARLDQGGLQWPCPDSTHPGTPRLHVGQFMRGLGHFSPVSYRPPAEWPDDSYPLVLTTGRLLYHYHSGTSTHRVPGLEALCPETLVDVNPQDAKALGISNGDLVKVSSRRGEVKVATKVSETCPPGMVFMDFHFSEVLTNALTTSASDPVAKTPELKVCAVRIEKLVEHPSNSANGETEPSRAPRR